ncbi:MAG: hypothetical protein ACOYNF_16460 [Rhodoferax sp.]
MDRHHCGAFNNAARHAAGVPMFGLPPGDQHKDAGVARHGLHDDLVHHLDRACRQVDVGQAALAGSGRQWPASSGGKCLFLMAVADDNGCDVAVQLASKIGPSAA